MSTFSSATARGLPFLVAVLALAGCEPTMGGEVVERRAAAWAGALDRGDLDAFVTRYERGAVFLPPGGHAVVGRSSIEARWRRILDRYEVNYEFQLDDVDADGRIGYAYGNYEIFGIDHAGGDTFRLENRFLQIWRRQRDGSWLIALDMWHPSATADPLLP